MCPLQRGGADSQVSGITSADPTDGLIAVAAAEYWRDFRARGITLGRADILIAATAKTLKLALVTDNIGHYPIDDIACYDRMPHL